MQSRHYYSFATIPAQKKTDLQYNNDREVRVQQTIYSKRKTHKKKREY